MDGENHTESPDKTFEDDIEHLEHDLKIPREETVHHPDPKLYIEALQKYPTDESIDDAEERKLIRKLDMRIIPLLGICYFFYVSLPTPHQPAESGIRALRLDRSS